MKIQYTITEITYDPDFKKYCYKYADRFDTYFQSFSQTLSHEECIAIIEKKIIGVAKRKTEAKIRDRSHYIGKINTIEV